jgi:tetratricopeptide (TPR) repeat protein
MLSNLNWHRPNLSVSSANSSSTAAIAPFKISSAIYADALDALASALFFQKAGDVVVCVRLHELALATMPPCAGENDAILAGLGTSRRWAWTKTWERCYLDSSTEAYHAALNARPVGHRDRAASLNDLGLIYRLAFIETGSLDSLDLSVKSYTEGLAASPIPVMELQLHGNLALALICRYEATAVARDIEDAVAHAREAYKCPSGHRYRNTATEALAESLYKHHRLTGDMAEFEECVQLRRQQLRRIPPPTGSLRATAVNNLGTLLLARYGYIKDVADLDEAVALFREALELVSDRSVSQAHALFRLARSLKLIFEETGRVDNLEEAMAVQKNLMSHARLHGSSYGEFLSAAAETCLLRFSTLQDRDDLEEAITLYRRAIEEVTVTHLHTYQYFDGLAHSLRKRFSVTKALSDATEAMTTQNTALSLVAPGHPERARMLAHLAGIFILPSAPFYSMEIAAGYLLAGLEDGHRHPQLRLSEGIEVVQMLEAQCGPSVTVKYHIRILILTAYRAAISLLPQVNCYIHSLTLVHADFCDQVACFGLDLRTRARVLTTSKDLATRAAAHALLISQPSTALEILEAGRAVFW